MNSQDELTPQNRTILLIEDDRDICEIVQQVLADEGYETIAVSNGAEGLERLRSSAPHPFVIVLDLMLPVMDAWQFRAEQAGDALLAKIPVVIFSANPKVGQHADALGAAAVLRKPPNLDELLSVVSRFAQDAPPTANA
ncbi:MAG TPA: response regulator [Polyangia bacterium]|jgi:two-component system chemotaxis response regulator CheY|nr:response regulator [Polyangia bacterium]